MYLLTTVKIATRAVHGNHWITHSWNCSHQLVLRFKQFSTFLCSSYLWNTVLASTNPQWNWLLLPFLFADWHYLHLYLPCTCRCMPSKADQPELLCNVLPTKPLMTCHHCFSCYSCPPTLHANKAIQAKKNLKETKKKKKPTAPQWKAEKQAAEIVKQPKLWSLKQLIVNEKKPHSSYFINC